MRIGADACVRARRGYTATGYPSGTSHSAWPPRTPKSLLSLLIGVHVGRGAIDIDKSLGELGIDDKPGLTEVEKRATVRQLIAESTRTVTPFPNRPGYAYMWWTRPDAGNVWAEGARGHFLLINARRDLVIVHRVGWGLFDGPGVDLDQFTALYRRILAAGPWAAR